jgi:hypothetical protein
MKAKDEVIVQYENGFANVLIGDRVIQISRQDETSEEFLCPVDLISASLGT